uniref:Uncharacterized protein n=1 Tax=Tanacetum cinerariifolium TaxID=118510 RepID=A0A699J879_TANCI|nr:hypothetical protein [Tanacetum cinerariifolium]
MLIYSSLSYRCHHQYPTNLSPNHPQEKKLFAFIKTLRYDEDPKETMSIILHFVATRLHQPWRAILSVLNRSLAGKDTSWDRARLLVLQILWCIVHSANLNYTSLIKDEFEWKGELKFGMEIPETMINNIIKKSARYYYKIKKDESEKDKAEEEPKEQHVSSVRRGRGKGVNNTPKDLKYQKSSSIPACVFTSKTSIEDTQNSPPSVLIKAKSFFLVGGLVKGLLDIGGGIY